jgi:hypothetical protein
VDAFVIAAAFDADELSAFAACEAVALAVDDLSAFAAACAAVIDDALAFVFAVEEASREESAVLADCAAMLASGFAAAEACVVASA